MLSVAVASAHMAYSTLVDAGGASPLGGGVQQQQHIERIPYIDSAVLLRELTTVGDSLCNMLLKQTGHGELVHNMILTEMLNNQSTLVASYGTKPVRKQAELAALEKSLKTAVVVPIFVLSDLHIHHERQKNTNADATEKKVEKKTGKKKVEDEDVLLPVQPLLNKVEMSSLKISDIILFKPPILSATLLLTFILSHPHSSPLIPSHPATLSSPLIHSLISPLIPPIYSKDSPVAVATDSRSAIVVHSSSGMVATFSPYTHAWRNRVDLTDVDSLIAEGLTRALTGLNAPYAQLQEAKG